jgi:hypothetical protein
MRLIDAGHAVGEQEDSIAVVWIQVKRGHVTPYYNAWSCKKKGPHDSDARMSERDCESRRASTIGNAQSRGLRGVSVDARERLINKANYHRA